jgi:hypothetical protein
MAGPRPINGRAANRRHAAALTAGPPIPCRTAHSDRRDRQHDGSGNELPATPPTVTPAGRTHPSGAHTRSAVPAAASPRGVRGCGNAPGADGGSGRRLTTVIRLAGGISLRDYTVLRAVLMPSVLADDRTSVRDRVQYRM